MPNTSQRSRVGTMDLKFFFLLSWTLGIRTNATFLILANFKTLGDSAYNAAESFLKADESYSVNLFTIICLVIDIPNA